MVLEALILLGVAKVAAVVTLVKVAKWKKRIENPKEKSVNRRNSPD